MQFTGLATAPSLQALLVLSTPTCKRCAGCRGTTSTNKMWQLTTEWLPGIFCFLSLLHLFDHKLIIIVKARSEFK